MKIRFFINFTFIIISKYRLGNSIVNLLVRGHSVKSKDCFHDDQQVTVSLSFGISCSGHILLLNLAVD